MKKMKQKIYIACALSALLLSGACDDNLAANKVPEAVRAQFETHYPGIDHVAWERQDSLFEAEFKISGREREAMFREDGTLVSYTEEIEERYLPAAILQQLQSDYSAYRIDEVHRIQQDGSTNFRVELDDKSKELELIFRESGELLQADPRGMAAHQKVQEASLLPASLRRNETTTLGAPDAQWELPPVLREVSGIALVENNLVACVQDELGTIFLYDLNSEKIIREIPFGAPGDYEGIALVNQAAYVLRSDGALLEVSDFRNGSPTVRLHQHPFPATINMEGLAYDAENEQLLLAPKGYRTADEDSKGIYAFSLRDKKMKADPVITVPLDQVEPVKSTKKKTAAAALQPSSLELHPTSGELYMLDAVNNRLYTLNRLGQIGKTVNLDKKSLRQAEGLAFGQDGAMYIASEGGKKGKGVIHRYSTSL